MTNEPLLTPGDIARLAGVGRAAVSNWRRRHDDFPEPVGGTANSPVFSFDEIQGWLRGQGKLEDAPQEEWVWQELRRLVDQAPLADVTAFAGTFLLYTQRNPQRWAELKTRSDAALVAELPEMVRKSLGDGVPLPPRLTVDHAPLVRALGELAAERGSRESFEFLRLRYLELHTRRLQSTPPEVARLMVALTQPGPRVIYDPVCGAGDLLLSAAQEGAHLVGQEIDEAAAALTGLRLALHTHDVEVQAGDSLRSDAFRDLRADVVLCNPPFNDRNWGYEDLITDPRWEYGLPPRMESELAWVQHALAHTKPGGTVVMLMPPAAAGRRSGRRIRRELIRAGVVRAVVALPVGAVPHMAVPLMVWLMRRPVPEDRVPQTVFMMDASEVTDLVESIVRGWNDFQRDPESYEESGIARAVDAIDLLDDEVDFSPGRYLARAGSADAACRYRTNRERLGSLLSELAVALPDTWEQVIEGDSSTVTIGELAKAGALTVLQPPLRMETDSGDIPVLTLQDLTSNRQPTGRTGARTDLLLLEPGDVVIPAISRRSVTRTISGEEAVLGPHLYLIRAAPGHCDPDFIAGFMRLAGDTTAARSSSGSSRVDVRSVRLPRLPLAAQRAYGRMFRELKEFEERLRTAMELAHETISLGFEAFATGSPPPER